MKEEQKKFIVSILKWIGAFIIATAGAVATMWGLSSCNVTRTISTESSVYQKGDTSVSITTRTIESYNAVKNK